MKHLNYPLALIVWFILVSINCLPEQYRKEYNTLIHAVHGGGLVLLFILARKIGEIEIRETYKDYKSYVNLRLQYIKNMVDETNKIYVVNADVEEKLYEISTEIQDTKEGI